MIKIGDRVKFISDTYVGEVVKIKGVLAEVEVEDGFVVPTMLSDLVVVNKEDELYAMRRIGVSDERPGTNKGSKQKEKKAVVAPKREAAYSRYGKVSIVEDIEDDEDIIDISELRAIYAKSVANLNAKELSEFEKEQPKKQVKEVVEEPVLLDEKAQNEVKEKMSPVSLDSLDKALNIKIKEDSVHIPKPKKETPKSDIEVIDLHAEQILDSTIDMTSGQILEAQLSRFNIALSLAVNSGKHGKIVFIHGVGSGKLKYELQKELSRKYSQLNAQDASFREYGYGALMIFY